MLDRRLVVFIRSALILATAMIVGGCALLPQFGDDRRTLLEEGVEEVRGVHGYAFGHGTGTTREEARQNAQEGLAAELMTHVRSEMRTVWREVRREEGERADTEIEEKLTASTETFVNVELEGAEVDVEAVATDGYYVRLRVPRERMAELRRRARRNAPALTLVDAVKSTADQSPGRRLRISLRGLSVAEELGLSDETVFTPSAGRTTFGAFFHRTVERSVDEMRVLPLVEGNRVHFAVLHEESLRPQRSLYIEVDGRELRTDRSGRTSPIALVELGPEFEVLILGYSRDTDGNDWTHPAEAFLWTETFSQEELRESEKTNVFVSTVPEGAVVTVAGRQRTSPAIFTVGSRVQTVVKATHGEEYRDASASLNIPRGAPYAYVNLELTERRFGKVDLSAQGRRSVIALQGPSGRIGGSGNTLARRVDAGTYKVFVDHEVEEDYQRIIDRLTLLEDDHIEREYAAPIYREPYTRGWRIGFTGLRIGGGFGDKYKVPWINGDSIPIQEMDERVQAVSSVDYKNTAFDLMLAAQRYFDRLNFTMQGSAGLRRHQGSINHGSSSVDYEIESYFASLGAGFWTSLGPAIASLTLNQAVELTSWNNEDHLVVQDFTGGAVRVSSRDTVTNSYGFLELNFSIGPTDASGYEINCSLIVPEEEFLDPFVRVGVGRRWMSSGYRHDATVRARQGVHY